MNTFEEVWATNDFNQEITYDGLTIPSPDYSEQFLSELKSICHDINQNLLKQNATLTAISKKGYMNDQRNSITFNVCYDLNGIQKSVQVNWHSNHIRPLIPNLIEFD